MIKNRVLAAFFVISIVISVTVFSLGRSKIEVVAHAAETAATVPESPKNAIAQPPAADQVKHKVMAFDLEGLADDGSKKWDVKGQSAESVSEEKVKLNKITASSYGKEAKATITADTGMYDKVKNNVRLEQNVKAVIENTPKNAGDFLNMPGQPAGARAEAALAGNAEKKGRTEIICDGEVEFNYEKNEGYFNKNVHVVNEDGTIDADRITVYLDSSTKTVKTIVADGNVKIRRGDNMTFSDKATYLSSEKKIILSGKPKIVMYQQGELGTDFLGLGKK